MRKLFLAIIISISSQSIEIHRGIGFFSKLKLKKDLSYLEKFKIQDSLSLEDLDLFKTSDYKDNFLSLWLSERVQLIVHTNIDRFFESELDQTLLTGLANTKGLLVNITGESPIFLTDKKTNRKFSIGVNSTRTMALNKRYFSKRFSVNNKKYSEATRIFRLSSLLHEAKHSEGSHHHHIICPVGHDYAGQLACDKSKNQAYHVSARSLEILAKNCKSCSQSDYEGLKLRYLDALNRIVEDK